MASAFKTLPASKKVASLLLGSAVAGGVALTSSFERSIKAGDPDRFAHPPHLRWPHENLWESYDAKSIRRGYEVYKNVCQSCHGCFTVAYRMLRNTCMTPEEAKAEAKSHMHLDGPNDEGQMFERPGKTVDYLKEPYANEAEAAFANGGKAPPNLGVIVHARHGYENYLFALLTGYQDPPAGYELDEGLHFNPYFRGGALAMPPPIYNEVLEYSDGTPATKSQVAKDVTCFLRFAAEPWHDERKKLGLKMFMLLGIVTTAFAFYFKKGASSVQQARVQFVPKVKK